MKRILAAIAVIGVVSPFFTGCGGGGDDGADNAASAESAPEVARYEAGPDDGRMELVDVAGLSLRAGCEAYGTHRVYLSLDAATDLEDAAIEARFKTHRYGETESYRFSPDGFSSDYGRWDVIGQEPAKVKGTLTYRSTNDESVTVRFRGNGGYGHGEHGRGPCRLATRTVIASAAPAAEETRSATPDPPPTRRWVPRPVVLGQGGVLRPCEVGPLGGGFDLWIKDISCKDANAWLRRLVTVVAWHPFRRQESYGRLEGGWECWSRLERRTGIHNVCVRGEQLVMFYIA